jgi:hypothetical protein
VLCDVLCLDVSVAIFFFIFDVLLLTCYFIVIVMALSFFFFFFVLLRGSYGLSHRDWCISVYFCIPMSMVCCFRWLCYFFKRLRFCI